MMKIKKVKHDQIKALPWVGDGKVDRKERK